MLKSERPSEQSSTLFVSKDEEIENKLFINFETSYFLSQWTPSSIVLTIEQRKCKSCGSVQDIPGGRLFIGYERTNEAGNECYCLRDRDRVPPPPVDLPQRIRYIKTDGETCLNCYIDEREFEIQLSLFPTDVKLVPKLFKQAIFHKRPLEEVLKEISMSDDKTPQADNKLPLNPTYPKLEDFT